MRTLQAVAIGLAFCVSWSGCLEEPAPRDPISPEIPVSLPQGNVSLQRGDLAPGGGWVAIQVLAAANTTLDFEFIEIAPYDVPRSRCTSAQVGTHLRVQNAMPVVESNRFVVQTGSAESPPVVETFLLPHPPQMRNQLSWQVAQPAGTFWILLAASEHGGDEWSLGAYLNVTADEELTVLAEERGEFQCTPSLQSFRGGRLTMAGPATVGEGMSAPFAVENNGLLGISAWADVRLAYSIQRNGTVAFERDEGLGSAEENLPPREWTRGQYEITVHDIAGIQQPHFGFSVLEVPPPLVEALRMPSEGPLR